MQPTDTKNTAQLAPLPWSHLINADEAGVTIERLSLSPNAEEMQALAHHFGVDALNALSADIVIQRIKAGLVVYIKGRFCCDILQTCVTTLEPMQSVIEEDFEAWYADPEQAISFQKALQRKELQRQHGEAPIIPEEDDPEPIEGGVIDLGDIVTQFVSLAIDPYPMKDQPDLGENEVVILQEDSPIRKNPFEALKDWKSKMEEKG